jgi:hypothetical protein
LTILAVLGTLLPAPAADIYVANYDTGAILRFNESGQSALFAAGPARAVSLAYYGGYLYVGSQDYTITRYDANGNGSLFYSADNFLPQGMAFDGAGNLFVSSYAEHRILRFDQQGNMSVFATSGVYSPTALAFDAGGTLYQANYYSGTIQRFDASGSGSLFASPGTTGNYPNSLAVDSYGNLFVGMVGGNQVLEYSPQGAVSVFASTGLNLPGGLAFDSNGNLLVGYRNARFAQTQQSIQRFDPQGNQSLFASSGLANPVAILTVVTPVPEPACGALMGCGALVLLWRGRFGTAARKQ